jgi:hypothetical protein
VSRAPAESVLGAIQQQAPEVVASLRTVMDEILRLGAEGKAPTQQLREQFRDLAQNVLDRFGVEVVGTGEKITGAFSNGGTAVKAFTVNTTEGLRAVSGALDKLVGAGRTAADAIRQADAASQALREGGIGTGESPVSDKPARAERDRTDALREFLTEKARETELIGKTREEADRYRLVQEAISLAQKRRQPLQVEELAVLGMLVAKRKQASDSKAEEKRAETVGEILRNLRQENELLQQQGPARAALAKSQQVENLLARAKVEATGDELAALQEALDLNRQLLELDQKRAGRTLAERKTDFLKGFDDEAALLNKTGKERERYQAQLEIENESRQQGLDLSKQEIADLTERRVKLQELAEAQRSATEAGRDFGQSVGDALSRIIIDGEKARDVFKDLAQQLAKQAFQRTVTNSLQQLGGQLFGAIGNSLAGGGDTVGGPGPGGLPSGPFGVPNMTGGVIPAMSGQVVDEFGFLRRGNRTYSFAEGGKSTPEAILPLERDARGRLGVVSAGGGGATNISMSFPGVRSARDARGMRATVGQQVRQVIEAQNRGRRGLRPMGQ